MIVRHPEAEPAPEELLAHFSGVDIVLAEDCRSRILPKIEVRRSACGHDLLCRGPHHAPQLAAVVTDRPLSLDVPVFDPAAAPGICDFLQEHFFPAVSG